MAFSLISDPTTGRCLAASDDDMGAFAAVFDLPGPAHGGLHGLLVSLHGALNEFLCEHPDHVDALAHLCLIAAELDFTDGAAIHAREALRVLRHGVADVTGGVGGLDPGLGANRLVLRLVRNATLAAWAAQDWEPAGELARLGVELCDDGEARDWCAMVQRREPLDAVSLGGR